MARAARCAGVTCTRHLQGAEIERFRRADWLHRSQRGVRPVHAGPVAVGRADALRVAITEVMAAHDAKSLWGHWRHTRRRGARHGLEGAWWQGDGSGSVVDLELGARGDLGHRLFDCLRRASFGARCARAGSSRLDAFESCASAAPTSSSKSADKHAVSSKTGRSARVDKLCSYL